jgi:hypothetical protein
MSVVVGIDLSSRQLDLAALDETTNYATHYRISLELEKSATAWQRTLALPDVMPLVSWWDDVYLVAIEAPYGHGAGTVAILNRIVGAVAASLPAFLREPYRCWIVRPDEWKNELGLKGKPSAEDVAALGLELTGDHPETQDARDAACLAYYARELNARALSA